MTKRLFAVLLALLLLCPLGITEAFATGSAKASISLSSSKITVGDTVTVTVQYSSDTEIGSYDFLLNYDATLLQYVSGSDAETGNGKLPFVNYNENDDPKIVKRSVKFKAIGTGTATFSTQSKALVNYNDFSQMSCTEAKTSITINAKPTASSDNSLKSLTISGGTFSPAFSSSTTKYTMEVEYSVKKLTVSAVANHSKAKVSVSGTDLALGENKITITVTAENGSKKTYTLTVNRKQSEFANVSTKLNGYTYVFAHDPDVLTPPTGFSATSALYDSSPVLGFTNEDGFFTLVWLSPVDAPEASSSAAATSTASASTAPSTSVPASSSAATEEPSQAPTLLPPREGWYMLLEDGLTLLPYTPLSASAAEYVPIPLPSDVALPEGCQSSYVMINNEEILAYRTEYCVNNGLYLIYARSSAGVSDFYYWHQESGSFYPYIRPETITVTVLVTEPSAPAASQAGATLNPSPSQNTNSTNKLYVFALACTGLLILLLILLLCLFLRHRKTKKELKELILANKRRRISRDPAALFGDKAQTLPSEPAPLPPPTENKAEESQRASAEESEANEEAGTTQAPSQDQE